ncbi:hypothetical protein EIN_508710 [Entamoeba invadens IP1]|uniref:Uncharacterized protein n=1 Tax=Entamoeba invadens IP1 TaxID=370355 RepID=A0A0A1UCI4_ENTIV|nr:hypothetical protein EIN_508710 [Entamoeba invadens IP1]ELP92870.1 hypothetical protein EIN_508710 [Entamoeba invadens IP1]|eukprot:XP_004259641.1 hypothetical protein EIN_508710 [Entamoeba invadens IP1]
MLNEKTRRMTVAIQNEGRELVFGCVEGENEIISKMLDELGKSVKNSNVIFKGIVEQWKKCVELEDEKKQWVVKAKSIWENIQRNKEGKWSELKEVLKKEVDEEICYTDDITIIDDTKDNEQPNDTKEGEKDDLKEKEKVKSIEKRAGIQTEKKQKSSKEKKRKSLKIEQTSKSHKCSTSLKKRRRHSKIAFKDTSVGFFSPKSFDYR